MVRAIRVLFVQRGDASTQMKVITVYEYIITLQEEVDVCWTGRTALLTWILMSIRWNMLASSLLYLLPSAYGSPVSQPSNLNSVYSTHLAMAVPG